MPGGSHRAARFDDPARFCRARIGDEKEPRNTRKAEKRTRGCPRNTRNTRKKTPRADSWIWGQGSDQHLGRRSARPSGTSGKRRSAGGSTDCRKVSIQGRKDKVVEVPVPLFSVFRVFRGHPHSGLFRVFLSVSRRLLFFFKKAIAQGIGFVIFPAPFPLNRGLGQHNLRNR